MSLMKWLIIGGAAGVVSVLGFGCSSSSSTPPDDEGGVVGNPEGGKKDSGLADTGVDETAAACVALDSVGSFTPTYKPPAAHKDACSQQNIDDFRKFCLGQGDQQACSSFLATANGKACAQCILTAPTAAALGPLIDHTSQGYVSLNTAGCLALAQGSDTCAKAISALSQCDDAACVNCKVSDQASLDELNACTNAAEGKACQTYVDPANCAETAAEAGQAGTCFAGNDFDTGYTAIVPTFCLKTGDGGGSDAPVDAGSDG